jgi:hypothetical protein
MSSVWEVKNKPVLRYQRFLLMVTNNWEVGMAKIVLLTKTIA